VTATVAVITRILAVPAGCSAGLSAHSAAVAFASGTAIAAATPVVLIRYIAAQMALLPYPQPSTAEPRKE
jgi:hypothetical protein